MLTSNLDTSCVVTITGQASLDMAYLFFYLALYDIGKQLPRVWLRYVRTTAEVT